MPVADQAGLPRLAKSLRPLPASFVSVGQLWGDGVVGGPWCLLSWDVSIDTSVIEMSHGNLLCGAAGHAMRSIAGD